MFVDSKSHLNEAPGACSDTIAYLVHMNCVAKSGYMSYMQMAQNFSCRPLLEQLSGRHQSLLWAMIRPFVYISHETIFIILVHGGFTWILHAL